MLCASNFEVGMFGSAFFLGFTLCGVLMQFISQVDRRIIIIISQIFVFFTQIGVLVAESPYARSLFLLFQGFGLIGFLEGYIMMTELIPAKYLIFCTSGTIILDQLLNIVIPTLYFYLGMKDWVYLYLFFVILVSFP